MKEYDDLQKSLQIALKVVCESDPYGLSPQTIYANIYNSSGSYETLAKIFDVAPSLVKAIKES